MSSNDQEEIVAFIYDAYEPISAVDVRAGVLPSIKYRKGAVGYLPREEAKPYIENGSAVTTDEATLEQYKEMLVEALEESLEEDILSIKDAIARNDVASFAFLAGLDECKIYVQRLLSSDKFNETEKEYLRFVLRYYKNH